MRRVTAWTIAAALACAALAVRAQPATLDRPPPPRMRSLSKIEPLASAACSDVTCSGHGECVIERGIAQCLCDEGYAARERSCERAETPERARDEALLGARIVRLALQENERNVRSVGEGRREYPYALRTYLTPGEMWCSDFVAWIYRAAGAPFTGGYEGGWLIRNNVAIRRWYERRGLWVARDAPGWSELTPEPGDYVRMHTQSGHGHSTIVRYVDAQTLWTIEGNVGQRVQLRRYPNYRRASRIDGFGITTRAVERRAELERARTAAVTWESTRPPRSAVAVPRGSDPPPQSRNDG